MDLLTIFLFLLGFAALIKGADLLVEGGASVAKRWNISNLVIGLTIVAFGSSAPELVVSILASMEGNGALVVGNILGSNLANILLILGVASLITPLTVHKNTVWKEIPLSFLAVLVLGFMANDTLIDAHDFSVLSRSDGLVLISFFMIFMYYTFGIAKVGNHVETDDVKKLSWFQSVLYILLGLVGLTIGGKWIVDGAISFAQVFQVSDHLIGLTVVAIGTSLPELATSAVAAYKGHTDIAIGNVVGSNIFNIFWVLGLSAIIAPLSFIGPQNIDLLAVCIASFLLFIFLFTGRKNKEHVLNPWEGALFLVLYVGFMVFSVYRG